MAAAAIITGINIAVAVAPTVIDIIKKVSSLIATIRKHSNPGPYDDTCLGAVAELRSITTGMASVTGDALPPLPNASSSTDTPALCAAADQYVESYRGWLENTYVPNAVVVRSALSPTSSQLTKSVDTFVGIDPTNASVSIPSTHPAYEAWNNLKTATADWVSAFGIDNVKSFSSLPYNEDEMVGGRNALQRFWVKQSMKSLLTAISTLALGTPIAPVDKCVVVASPAVWELKTSDFGIHRQMTPATYNLGETVTYDENSVTFDCVGGGGKSAMATNDVIVQMDADPAADILETWLTTLPSRAMVLNLDYAGTDDHGPNAALFVASNPLPKETCYNWYDTLSLMTVVKAGAGDLTGFGIAYFSLSCDPAPGAAWQVNQKGILKFGQDGATATKIYSTSFSVPIYRANSAQTRIYFLLVRDAGAAALGAGITLSINVSGGRQYAVVAPGGKSYGDVTYRLTGATPNDYIPLADRNVSMLDLMGKLEIAQALDDPNYSVQAIFEERHVGALGPMMGLAIAALKTYADRVKPGVLDAKYVALGYPGGITDLVDVSSWMSGSGPFGGKSSVSIQKGLMTLIHDLMTLNYYVKATDTGSKVISSISGPLPTDEIF